MPAAQRHDHLGGMAREAAGATPEAEAPADAPLVVPALIDYLEQQFPHPFPTGASATTVDQQVYIAAVLANYAGSALVIAHLKSLMKAS